MKSLMNLIDCITDEFQDDAKISQMEGREVVSWVEVGKNCFRFLFGNNWFVKYINFSKVMLFSSMESAL